MYAIFETGGKQYKVEAGDVLRIEKIEGKDKSKVKFDKVLAFSDGKKTKVGTPYLEAATVNATITGNGKGEKVIIFKFKNKKDYRRKQGHRQPFTEIEIDNFTIDGKAEGKKPAKKAAPKAAVKKDESESKADDTVKADDKKAAPKKETKAKTTEKKTEEKKPAAKKTAAKKETAKKDTETTKKETKAAPKKKAAATEKKTEEKKPAAKKTTAKKETAKKDDAKATKTETKKPAAKKTTTKKTETADKAKKEDK